MSDEIDVLGDGVGAAMTSRAVEPDAGESRSGEEQICSNCTAALSGNHCHKCGQKAKVHRTLSAFWHDFLHSVLHFDGKIWRTLPLLAWKPGELTRRYIHGERAKFVSPLALFLFCVFLTFAAFNISDGVSVGGKNTAGDANFLETAKAEVQKDYKDDIAELMKERAEAVAEGSSTKRIDVQLERKTEQLNKFVVQTQASTSVLDELQAIRRQTADRIAQLQKDADQKAVAAPISAEKLKLEGINSIISKAQRDGVFPADRGLQIDIPGLPGLEAAAREAANNPQLLIYKLQSNAYKFSWALIPISLPMLWLLFFRRRTYFAFDHAVFITYSLCFMMLLLCLWSVLQPVPLASDVTMFLLILGPPVHMFRQLRGAYQLSFGQALWRTLVLLVFALLALLLFMLLIFYLGIT